MDGSIDFEGKEPREEQPNLGASLDPATSQVGIIASSKLSHVRNSIR